ncbi:MAG: hypothetical protein WA755_14565 [Candidatus Acidiferrales bacterium]
MTQTTGELFHDGTCLELLRDPESGGATLIFYDGEKSTIAPWIKTHDRIYTPPDMDSSILRAVTLPSSCSQFGSTRELFTEIFTLISRTTRQANNVVAELAFFVFATWCADRLPLAPLLWIVAPPTTSSGPLLQLLGLLCRRALLVTEPNLAALRSAALQMKPTILTEVAIATRAFTRTIRASNRRGTYMVAGEKVLDLSCARVVFAAEPLREPASAGFPLEIAMAPTRDYVPVMEMAEAERIAEDLQAKLLMYRLKNGNKVAPPNLNLGELTAPMQEIAHTLAACIVGDEDLQAQIVPLLRPRDREIEVDRAAMLEAIVLEALLAACHEKLPGALPIVGLTQRVNTILAGRGETSEVSPEKVGWKLRALGLHTESVTGGRKGIALHSETRAMIHRLAAAYGVRTLREHPVNNCPHCAELEMPRNRGTDESSEPACTPA